MAMKQTGIILFVVVLTSDITYGCNPPGPTPNPPGPTPNPPSPPPSPPTCSSPCTCTCPPTTTTTTTTTTTNTTRRTPRPTEDPCPRRPCRSEDRRNAAKPKISVDLNWPLKGQCPANDYECQCKMLISSLVTSVNLQEITSTCKTQTGYQGSTSTASNGESAGNIFRQFPDGMQDCIVKGTMTELGLLDAEGNIKVTETVASITNKVDKTIADAVTPCAAEAKGQKNMYVTFSRCLEKKCVAGKSVG